MKPVISHRAIILNLGICGCPKIILPGNFTTVRLFTDIAVIITITSHLIGMFICYMTLNVSI